MTTALLIIDVQHALCSGEYEAFEFKRNETLANITSFGPRAVAVPASEVKIDA